MVNVNPLEIVVMLANMRPHGTLALVIRVAHRTHVRVTHVNVYDVSLEVPSGAESLFASPAQKLIPDGPAKSSYHCFHNICKTKRKGRSIKKLFVC